MSEWCGAEPRRWQREALDAVLAAMRKGVRGPLVHACTGAGKSLWIAELAARCKGRVLVTTPTQALVEQLAGTISRRCPGEVGQAFQHAWQPFHRIVVTCTASLERLVAEQPRWACWIADEAHRIEGDVLRDVCPRIQRTVGVGLTATPFRGDSKGLRTWDDLVYSYASTQAIDDRVLVPWRVVRWDGAGEPDTDRVVAEWVRQAEGPGIVSALTIRDADQFAERIGAQSIHQRLSRAERAARLEALRAGQVRCLVHVQLLTEGVDLPWLRWIALRRPVASPVRLVQEVGRVLRAFPGKSEAVIFDPHDLLGELGLVHAAALEDVQRRAVAGAAAEEWSIPELEGLDEVSRLPAPVAVDAVSGWVTDLLGELRAHGLAKPPAVGEGRWRRITASDAQLGALGRLSWAARYLPDERHRRAVRWLLARPRLTSGAASDLIDVLSALASASAPLRQQHRHWRPPFRVPEVVCPAS